MNAQNKEEKNNQIQIKESFIKEFTYCLYSVKKEKNNTEIIFLCIGTDKLIGDCLGPLVGTKLKEKLLPYNIFNITVYGTLQETVGYTNVEKTIKYIKKQHENACIVVVDAALSKKEKIGQIFVKRKQMELGKGLNKKAIQIGDISIKAVVGKDYKIAKYNFSSLQNISLNLILILAQIITDGICETIKYI